MQRKGFTLIEIMIVIVIIGLLAAMVIPRVFSIINQAKITEGLSIATILKNANLMHYADKGAFTISLVDLDDYIETADVNNAGWRANIHRGQIQPDYSISGVDGFAVTVVGSGNPGEISSDLIVQMDNSGLVIKSFDGGSSWEEVN